MYRHCIYCSADLGRNEALEAFPVGRTVAVDAARGRLWAICGKCSRWNLSPIEERWEAVEAAEKAFVDARLRVQRENIGIAGLADGTRLVRIGAALTHELAAWRYGAELRRRFRWIAPLAAATVGVVALANLPLGLWAAPFAPALFFGGLQWAGARRRVTRLTAADSPTGAPLDIRGVHVAGAVVRPGEAPGAMSLDLPMDGLISRYLPAMAAPAPPVRLHGEVARRTLERAMPLVNRLGGSGRDVDDAVERLAAKQSHGLIDAVGRQGGRLGVLFVQSSDRTGGAPLAGPAALAFEMALHEESERRALEGELTLLAAAWREAELIAGIADSLATPELTNGSA